MSAYHTEHRLLLTAARHGRKWDERVSLDWDYLIGAARAHGVLAQVLECLGDAAPSEAQRRLRADVQAASHRSLLLVSRLQRILAELEAGSVPVLIYKGPAIAIQAYGQLALRPFADLDLLVRPRDLRRASELLTGLGYEAFPKLTPARWRSYLASECECWFDTQDRSSPVELHWAVRERLYSFPLDLEGVFARAQRFPLCGRSVLTMAPEDLLLVLCIHGAKHAWCQLKWICDVDRLLAANPQLNWEVVFEQARRLRGERLLLVGLGTASEVLGTHLPTAVQSRLGADKVAGQLVRGAMGLLGFEELGIPLREVTSTRYLRSREDLRDRLRFCVESFTTPTLADWEETPLPDFLFPLYYLIRPLRLAGQRARLIASRPRPAANLKRR